LELGSRLFAYAEAPLALRPFFSYRPILHRKAIRSIDCTSIIGFGDYGPTSAPKPIKCVKYKSCYITVSSIYTYSKARVPAGDRRG
jgi:hypothetical protein